MKGINGDRIVLEETCITRSFRIRGLSSEDRACFCSLLDAFKHADEVVTHFERLEDGTSDMHLRMRSIGPCTDER